MKRKFNNDCRALLDKEGLFLYSKRLPGREQAEHNHALQKYSDSTKEEPDHRYCIKESQILLFL